MEQLAYLGIGLLVGAAAIWLVLRERIASSEMRVKGDSQVELARLNERLAAAQDEIKRLAIEHAALQQQATVWRNQLDTSRDECAQLSERAARQAEQLASMQKEIGSLAALRDQLTAERQRLSNQVAELAAMLEAERAQSAEKLQLLQNAEVQLADRFKTLAS
jgi:DNA recombination protein RmuC